MNSHEKLCCDNSFGYHLPNRQGIDSLNKVNVTNSHRNDGAASNGKESLLLIIISCIVHALNPRTIRRRSVQFVACRDETRSVIDKGLAFFRLNSDRRPPTFEILIQH